MVTVNTIIGPAFAASYLVNGDASGLSEEDRRAVDAWCEREGVSQHCFASCDGEGWFTWSFDLYFPEGNARGGDVLEYTYLT